jgi:hypothetical protein
MIFLLEIIAFIDLYSDIYILIHLLATGHTAWASLTLYTMLSPYLISYIPLINFQIQYYEQIGANERSELSKNMEAMGILTPIVLIYLALMDVFYIVASVGLNSITFLLNMLSCGLIKFIDVNSKMDNVYGYLFHMKSMDIEHFRHLRTISQLSYESAPQIIL